MPDSAKKVPPKGGRKGGTTFPRISLGDALTYSAKLVAKTHSGPQSKNVVFKGVFDNSGPIGGVRASALKQYGLLLVDKRGYLASPLAKAIDAAPDDEKVPLLRTACVAPALFKGLYETFQSDEVTKSKIRQQASNLNVHPEFAETCVDLFVSSMETAALAKTNGDKIRIVASSEVGEVANPEIVESNGAEQSAGDDPEVSEQEESSGGDVGNAKSSQGDVRPRATIQVNVTLDSSLDTEKLEKQLALLRKYGAL